jgi:hypothetical protein
MILDMRNRPDCEVPPAIHAIGICAAKAGDAAAPRACIAGFI